MQFTGLHISSFGISSRLSARELEPRIQEIAPSHGVSERVNNVFQIKSEYAKVTA
jgi:hypothetical protein